MHEEVEGREGWISEGQFLRALDFFMLLPRLEAQHATCIGWRMHGTLGEKVAGALFVIPSIFVMLALSHLAVAHIGIPVVAAALWGIQPVVVAVVATAVVRIENRYIGMDCYIDLPS